MPHLTAVNLKMRHTVLMDGHRWKVEFLYREIENQCRGGRMVETSDTINAWLVRIDSGEFVEKSWRIRERVEVEPEITTGRTA